jgi:C_GCAxxG_C_C family probable redox protein
VGEHLVDDLQTQSLRMATGFSGGLGDTREELCGALSGGVMVIGALHGRTSLEEDDQPAIQLAARYRSGFLEEFGYTQCVRLRERVVNVTGGLGTCGALVEQATLILLGLLTPGRR